MWKMCAFVLFNLSGTHFFPFPSYCGLSLTKKCSALTNLFDDIHAVGNYAISRLTVFELYPKLTQKCQQILIVMNKLVNYFMFLSFLLIKFESWRGNQLMQ